MSSAIRNTLLLLPLGLIIAGCASSRRTHYAYSNDSRSTHRSEARPASYVHQSPDDVTYYEPVRVTTTSAKHDVTVEQIRASIDGKSAIVIDARSPEDYSRGHVRGAMNVPASDLGSQTQRVEQMVSRDQAIIIYCGGPTCGAGEMVYEHLAGRGYTNMRVFTPGWARLSSERDLH
jgi:rhodanese-related sulfurtransferase